LSLFHWKKKVTNENQDFAEALGEVVLMPTWAFTPTRTENNPFNSASAKTFTLLENYPALHYQKESRFTSGLFNIGSEL
jgi:hypothetical protein